MLPEAVVSRIAQAVSTSRAEGTRCTYASAWRRFEAWCITHGHTELPAHPVTVAAYLVDAADTYDAAGERAHAPMLLAYWVSAIGHHHRTAGHPTPHTHDLVRSTLSGGIRRNYASNGDRPRSPRVPLLVDDVVTIVGSARQAVTGWAAEVHERRDSAMLLMGLPARSGAATSSPGTVGT